MLFDPVTPRGDACAAYGVQLPRRPGASQCSTIVVSAMLLPAAGGANNWWVEFSISSSVASRLASRSSAGAISLSTQWGKSGGLDAQDRDRTRRRAPSGRYQRTRGAHGAVPLPRRCRSTTFGGFQLVRNADGNGSALPTGGAGRASEKVLHRCARGSVPRRHVGADEEPCVCLPRPGNERDAARVSRSVTQRHRLRSLRCAGTRILCHGPTRPPQ